MNETAKTGTAGAPMARAAPSEWAPMGWLRGEIDRLFEGLSPPAGVFNIIPRVMAPVPAMELIEKDNEYQLSAELPGLTDKDVEIVVTDGMLTVSGEKKEECERKDEGYLLSERRYGSFRRQIALPADVQPDSIKARFQNGVLNVTLAKDKQALERTHRIPIEN